MRSQLSEVQDRGEGICDRVNELAGRIEFLSGQVDLVKSLRRGIEAVTRDTPQIKTDVDQIKKSVDQIERRIAALQTRATSTSEISRAPNAESEGVTTHDIAPKNRGGGPRTPDRGNGEGKPIRRSSLLRPQLVARRDTGDWQIYVDIEHETMEALCVVHGEAQLNEGNGVGPALFWAPP